MSLRIAKAVLWSMEWWVKPISTSTHPEFLVKIKELTTLTCCAAFPTEFVGFHRGECWGISPLCYCQTCFNLQVDLSYAHLLSGYEPKPQLWAFQECSEHVECNVKGQKESCLLSKILRGNHFFSSFKITSLVQGFLDSCSRLGLSLINKVNVLRDPLCQ